jgi:hypothetical protein
MFIERFLFSVGILGMEIFSMPSLWLADMFFRSALSGNLIVL